MASYDFFETIVYFVPRCTIARLMFIDAAIIVKILFFVPFSCATTTNKRARNSFGSSCSFATQCYIVSHHNFHACMTGQLQARVICDFFSSFTSSQIRGGATTENIYLGVTLCHNEHGQL
jgi:hypothetical protein